jgi:lipopolysaccharide transport system permease protein
MKDLNLMADSAGLSSAPLPPVTETPVDPKREMPDRELPDKDKQLQRLVIEPASRIRFQLLDLWEYRELLYFLFWRDLKVRYKQTLLGASWAILQPLVTTIVFTIFLGRVAKIGSDGLPYSLFVFSGLLPWQLFAFSLTQSSASLVNSQQLITKVYFPRLIIPVSATLVGLVDFVVSCFVLAVMMLYRHAVPTIGIIFLPLLVLFAIVAALGAGLALSALNVRYRDVRHTIPFLIQIWMFATPIVYPMSSLPEKWRFLFGINPMVGVVEGFRWALFGRWSGNATMMIVSAASVVCMFFIGLTYFRSVERSFADLV